MTLEEHTYEQAMQLFHKEVKKMLADPLLSDLHENITLNELKSKLAHAYGQALTLSVIRGDGQVYKIIVEREATVAQLKRAIRDHVNLKLSREGSSCKVNWKYVWKNNYLVYAGQKLKKDDKKLADYNLSNYSEITFIKRS